MSQEETQKKESFWNSVGTWKIISGLLAGALIGFLFSGVDIQIGGEGSQEGAHSSVAQEKQTGFVGSIIPSGIPEVYGAELDVAYDDVTPDNPQAANEAIEKMAEIDRSVKLEGDDLERYVNILYHMHDGISCEYCCGARSIIFPNGEPACGCEHSFAMRGLTKHLIVEHGDTLSDEEILTEVGKWKVLFFPEIHKQKADVMANEGIKVDYVALTVNANRGIEEGPSGGMVGGC